MSDYPYKKRMAVSTTKPFAKTGSASSKGLYGATIPHGPMVLKDRNVA
jgi:hypothetical protein